MMKLKKMGFVRCWRSENYQKSTYEEAKELGAEDDPFFEDGFPIEPGDTFIFLGEIKSKVVQGMVYFLG